MRFIKYLIVLAAVLILFSPARASNTVSYVGNVIEISAIDSDWNSTETRKIQYIIFVPGASNDVLVMKEASATGPTVVYMKSTDGEPRIAYLEGQSADLYLDYSDCTFNTGAKVLIMLWEKK